MGRPALLMRLASGGLLLLIVSVKLASLLLGRSRARTLTAAPEVERLPVA